MKGGSSASGTYVPRQLPADLAAQLVPRGRRVPVRQGQVLIAEGTLSTDVFFIISGQLSVSVVSVNGRETVFRTMGANELVGELAAIDAVERSATVVALDAGVVCQLTADQFRSFLSQVPEAGLWLMRQMTDRVRDLSARAIEMANLSVGGRVVAELLRLAPDCAGSDTAVISALPTHADLAARIGTNRETVTRELRSLAGQGFVSQSGRTLTIASLARLRQVLLQQQR